MNEGDNYIPGALSKKSDTNQELFLDSRHFVRERLICTPLILCSIRLDRSNPVFLASIHTPRSNSGEGNHTTRAHMMHDASGALGAKQKIAGRIEGMLEFFC